jgi:hypothetical protein
MFRPQGVFQALRVDGRFEGQTELLPRRPGWCGSLLGPVVMEPQGVGGEVMLGEHSLDPTVIDGVVVAVSDDPRQFPSGEGVGDGQTRDVLPNVSRQEDLHRGLPPGVTQGAPIDQAQEAIAPKAP